MINLDEFFNSILVDTSRDRAADREQTESRKLKNDTQHKPLTPLTPKQEQMIEIFQMYQENIKKSESLRTRINHGINNKESHTELLLLSLECIASMTGEKIFFTENKKKLERN